MNTPTMSVSELQERIKFLEDRLSYYEEIKQPLNTKTVDVPENFEAIFELAQENVKNYFKNLKRFPDKGTIEINDERYILVRASALSVEFFENIFKLYSDKSKSEAYSIGKSFLFDFGHLIGKEDARKFHKKMNLTSPIEKLSAGPVHFAHSGWAFVEILPESNPTPDENFFLKYNHPYSFEADSWLKQQKKSDESVCIMNTAYSSGWCSESFGIPLTAVEISCKAKGDDTCTFIMASPKNIEHHLKNELQSKNILQKPTVPFFFERKEIEEQLKSSEKLMKEAQSLAKIGVWEFNITTEELYWSDELISIFEFQDIENKNLYQSFLNSLSQHDLNDLQLKIRLAIEKGVEYKIEHSITLRDGKVKWISSSAIPIKNENGIIYKLKGISQDISDRISSERELKNFFELSIDLLCIANMEGYFLKLSPHWTNLLGYSNEELCASPFIDFVHPDDIEKTLFETNKLNTGILTIGFENRYRCKNGMYINLSWNVFPDKVTGLLYATARDITMLKVNEEKLKNSNKEKEILLKEIHHRVKNNLQIISSLLSLQSSFVKEDKFKDLYQDSQNRIKSMSSVHELLYQSNDISRINYEQYLKHLLNDLIQSFKGNPNNIQLIIHAPNIYLNIDCAIPLGLLINEVVTNSLKYGIPNENKGKIEVEIEKLNHDNYKLVIGDDGVGYAKEFDFESSSTLGLTLIHSLAFQLDGTIIRDVNKKGTYYELIFKNSNPALEN
jgi:PAS domain S-box-containing protein